MQEPREQDEDLHTVQVVEPLEESTVQQLSDSFSLECESSSSPLSVLPLPLPEYFKNCSTTETDVLNSTKQLLYSLNLYLKMTV